MCREEIKQGANKCRHCGEFQNTKEVNEMNENYQKEAHKKTIDVLVLLILGVCFVLFILSQKLI